MCGISPLGDLITSILPLIGLYSFYIDIFARLIFVYHSPGVKLRVFLGIHIAGLVLSCICLACYISLLFCRKPARLVEILWRLWGLEIVWIVTLGILLADAVVWTCSKHPLAEQTPFSYDTYKATEEYAFGLAWMSFLLLVATMHHIVFTSNASHFAEREGEEPEEKVARNARKPTHGDDRRISAHIVAVQHGSPPEMWGQKKKTRARPFDVEAWAASLPQRAPQTPDPRSRPLRPPPPVVTSGHQWYVVPGALP